jgi:predicted dehydrogenase
MLQQADFDIVYISTPHPLHYEEILKALEFKRSILVEKPATLTAAQYRLCIELAKRQV